MYNYSNIWYNNTMDDIIILFNKIIKKQCIFTEKEQNLLNDMKIMILKYNLTFNNLTCLEIAIQSLHKKLKKDTDFNLFKTKIKLLKNALYGFV